MRKNYLDDKQIILNSFFDHKNTVDLLLDDVLDEIDKFFTAYELKNRAER